VKYVCCALYSQYCWLDWLTSFKDHLRYMRYGKHPPEVNTKLKNWVYGHTDLGSFTLLFRQPVAALQIRHHSTNEWKWVKPQDATLTVNACDALEFLTGGYVKSTVHRSVIASHVHASPADSLGGSASRCRPKTSNTLIVLDFSTFRGQLTRRWRSLQALICRDTDLTTTSSSRPFRTHQFCSAKDILRTSLRGQEIRYQLWKVRLLGVSVTVAESRCVERTFAKQKWQRTKSTKADKTVEKEYRTATILPGFKEKAYD
jgi:hypothetical protein